MKADQLKKHLEDNGFEVIRLSHAFRINGVVDIWFMSFTVFDNVKKEYHAFNNQKEQIQNAISIAKSFPKQEPFKKCGSGRMTYQEFKNRKATGR